MAPESYKSWEEMGEDREQRIAELKPRYCPPLDESMFLAILSDYDLSFPKDSEDACKTLDMLAEDAYAEESTGFDPSGGSGAPVDGVAQDNSEGHSTFAWSSTTDDTSFSQGFATLGLDGSDLQNLKDKAAGGGANSYDAQFKGMDLAAKEAVLFETFPGLKPYDIKHTLKKCKGGTEKAMEELLNQVYLEENVGRRQGIEGFSESDIPPVKKKGRNRRRQEASAQNYVSTTSDTRLEVAESKWESARRDVDTISNLTGVPTKQVSSLYHKHGTLIPPVLNAIIDAHQELGIDDNDSSMHLKALELNQDYPAIPITRHLAIIQICTTAHSLPRDLVRALTSRSSSSGAQSPTSPIQLEFRLAPPDLSGPSESKLKPKSHNAVYTDGQSSQQTSAYATDGKDYKTLRNEAFNQATAAYRKCKSDRLMGSAAAYYSSVGRDYDAKAKSAVSATADATAARQSTTSQLDLHGIGVADAVRIARETVTAWWVGLGDRVNGHGGYKIITGKGTHSEGGVARVGPAVSRMLIREGWRVEVGSGSMVVTGVVKVGKGM
ncbi:hypothetical protein VC83_07631 [Pseudogymnoascus destructans]|uniref:Smr domain-containing protein n=2 Tax=Pseudogymnoascus destructans TaxID=655981 RepID=L8FYN0_PSED2|nr:uncharacterized protein VC83_07631 [Pseudogymnoascus destructans]ELR05644.1 hypothetical protein GMDG_01834 [Pseudogymnoascus destructans 20631-21]OAF55650.1 hypothetical protein VC83_07631 [Pseudogymnoascus destructans]